MAAATPAVIDPAAFAQALQPTLQTMVQEAVAPALQRLQADVARANDRLTQALQPQRSASTIFGGAPGQAPYVQSGEFSNSSRGYQFYRALGLRAGIVPAEQCKVELDIHERLTRSYAAQGFVPSAAQSILCPLAPDLLIGDVGETAAAELGSMIRQGIAGADRDELTWTMQKAGMPAHVRTQALSQFDDSGMGGFVGPAAAGGLIELVRAKEVFSRLGATQLAMPPNGRLRFDRQTGASTAYWLPEVPSNLSSPTITASEPTTGSLDMIAKKLGCLVKLPNELLRFSGVAVESFMRSDLARVISLEADKAMLEGVPNGLRIKGLLYYDGIVNYEPVTAGTDGNTFEPEDIGLMLAALEDHDHDTESPSMGWAMRGRMWRNILNRRAAAHTAGVYDGGWMFPVNRGDIARGAPGTLDGYRVVRSSQISANRVKNAGDDLTYVLLGVWEHWLIARMGVIEFATSTQGDTPFQTDQTWVRAIQHLDAAPRYENAFVLYDQIDMALPTISGT